MKIFATKKRAVILALATTATLGVTAVGAGAIGSELPLRGTGTFCLSPAATQALAARNMTLEAIAPATATGNCVTLPGTGKLAPDLTGGEIPLQGGMRFSTPGHQLDVTNMRIHVHPGQGSTSADVSPDGSPATNIDLFHYPLSLDRVSFTPTTVDTKDFPLSLTDRGATAFTGAFGDSPVTVGEPLFLFTGHAEITNPLDGFSQP
ncbi:HtaA domain-containing protein [Kitasatospora kifunensis]|uniref:Htaa domain-containing protein n=1 Tax=Kitasatospora kifunensis TaxID=58351 RepID=A0A7W7R952_KITKI|nr:HtaA domain-containing protein [Kitasatospora kifunensis]MBB4927693.1 hypothetical protein [Kitasatospora kifunensis]